MTDEPEPKTPVLLTLTWLGLLSWAGAQSAYFWIETISQGAISSFGWPISPFDLVAIPGGITGIVALVLFAITTHPLPPAMIDRALGWTMLIKVAGVLAALLSSLIALQSIRGFDRLDVLAAVFFGVLAMAVGALAGLAFLRQWRIVPIAVGLLVAFHLISYVAAGGRSPSLGVPDVSHQFDVTDAVEASPDPNVPIVMTDSMLISINGSHPTVFPITQWLWRAFLVVLVVYTFVWRKRDAAPPETATNTAVET